MKPALAAICTSLVAASALAETSATGKVEFNILSVQGLVTGVPFTADAKFATQHKVSVPAPFKTVVPVNEAFQTLSVPAPKPGVGIVKFNFASQDGKRLLENIQAVPLTVPMLPLEARVKAATQVVAEDGVRMMTAGKQNPTRDVVRQTKVGPYDATEVLGTYVSPDIGLMYYRLVGVLNPKSEHCMMLAATVVAREVKVPSPDDMAKTRSGAVIQAFRYTN
jgi:hypothetical protein